MVIPAVLVGLVCVARSQWRDARLGGLELLDTRQRYTPEQAADLFGALDLLYLRSRAVYAWTEVSIDLIFPVAYGLLLALTLLRVFDGGRPSTCCRSQRPPQTSSRTYPSRRLGECGGGLHAAQERAAPGSAGGGTRWRDSMAVGRSTRKWLERAPQGTMMAINRFPMWRAES